MPSFISADSSCLWNRQVTVFKFFTTKRLKDGKGFKSMICSCVCTNCSSSPAENSKFGVTSKFCKGCGGSLLGVGREAQQGIMLTNGGLELSSVINPHLTWKTASNGRQRAVRRARTSFTGVNRKSSPAESLKVSKDIMDNNSKSTGDMPVSESEKVGVSILGRRFSDDLGSIPIKKRRFLLVHSPSSPRRSSSYSDGSGRVIERQATSYQYTLVNEKMNSFHMNLGSRSEFGQERNLAFQSADSLGVNEKICDAADFSGISILAAAACDGNMGCDFTNAEGSLSKADATEVGVAKENGSLDLKPHKQEEPLPYTSEDLTGRSDLPFDVSSSSVLPSKESNEVKSDGSVSSFHNIQNEAEDSSRDVRFPWDLNTAIDAWESHGEILNSDPEATNVSEDADCNGQDGNPGSSIDYMRPEDTENTSVDMQTGGSRDHFGGGECEVFLVSQMKAKEKPSTSSDDLANDSMGSNPCFDTLFGGKHLKNVKTDELDSEETKSSINKEMISTVSGNSPSPVKGVVDSVAGAFDFSLSSDAFIEERKEEATCIPFRSEPETEKSSSYLVSNDNAIADPATNGYVSHHGIHEGPFEAGTDAEITGITHTRSPQAEKHNFLGVDLLACPLAEKSSEFLVCGDACENIIGAVTCGSNVRICVSDETGHGNPKCEEKDACDCGTIAVGMKMDTPKMRAPFDGMDAAIVGSDVSACRSSDVTPGNALSANITDDSVSNSVQVATENHLDCPDASQNVAADQATGMEKAEFLGDNDSQFEDGEFRESFASFWLDDGVEEGETEHLDYGSDRDTDIYEGASNSSSISRHVDNVGQLNAEVWKVTQNAYQSFHKSSLLPGSENMNAESIIGRSLQGNKRAAAGKDMPEDRDVSEADDSRKSSQSVGLRKMSGWDQLPGSCRNSEPRLISISQKHKDFSSDPPCVSTNRGVGSSSRRDLSSRTDGVQSSDMSRRSYKTYDRPSRSNECSGFSPRAERHGDDPRLLGRRGPPVHSQGRGRGGNWVDSFSCHASSQHNPSGYYGSRNAAAAAVAKIESNGFVVAPDGTIVKAGGAGSASNATRQSMNASSRNSHHSPMGRGSPTKSGRMFTRAPVRSREIMSPDRSAYAGRGNAGRYGYEMNGASHRERYRRGPMPDDIIKSPSSLHHAISRRERSFSPVHRRPLHLLNSRSRSPSRSRTRSPHRWPSPRGRCHNVMNGSPGLRRRSRSPIFRSEARMDGPRAAFASLPRKYPSPPRTSRWVDGRKETPEQFREYDYKRCPERSPPRRVFSRGRRFDSTDPEGRRRPNEYSPPLHPGRVKGFLGFGRGSRNDAREHADRYKTLIGGNANTRRPNSSEFHRRDGLRAFDRDTERPRGDSPRRSRDEKGHFRNGNEGNHDTNLKSLGVRDGDSGIAAEMVDLND